MDRRLLSVLCLVVLACASPAPLFAGGAWLYETGSPDMGTASAGRAALAEDASTAFGNPAGMMRLDRSQVFGGLQGVIPSIRFDTKSGTTVSGGGGGNAGVALPGASGYYVHKLSDNWRLGVALNSYLAGLLDYGDEWSGRYYVQDTTFLTFNLNPVAAYRVNDWLSIGAGPMLVYGYMESKAAINNSLDGLPDGQLKVSSDTVGIGGNMGVLLEPLKGTRIGITYKTPVDLDFKDVPEIKNLGPTLSTAVANLGLANKEVDMSLTMPQEVMLSVYQDVTDRLALVANVGWQDWSEFARAEINFVSTTGTSFATKLAYKDTYHFAFGVRYRVCDPWMVMAGFAYDTSASSESTRSPYTPFDRQFRYALGVRYTWSENLTIGAAYEFLDAGEASINRTRGPLSGTLVGEYESDYYNFLSAYVSYKF